MKEVWRDIKDYEGLYKISSKGKVFSLKTNKLMKINKCGEYDYVALYKNSKKKIQKIHRLVAENFIENPNNLECINHKDENKRNNRVYNLEWCTKKYNCNYGKRNEKMSKSLSKYKIIQKDIQENIINIWDNIWDLEHNTNFNKWVIRQCCKNRCKTAYGYKWEYLL